MGVARQYSGTLGRTDNCQVALGQLEEALAWGVRRHVVLADAGYGDAREFREALGQRGPHYLVGVQSNYKVWPPGARPQQPPRVAGQRGRPSTRYTAQGVEPWSHAQLALQLPEEEWHTVHWREGSRGRQSSRFAAVRVRSAARHVHGMAPGQEEWLLVEWPRGEEAPTKYALCSLPSDTELKKLVHLWKLRWRVERDYQEMKQEVGLHLFEGRSWRGFHHHATLCAVAHGFLVLRRALFPPQDNSLDAAAGT